MSEVIGREYYDESGYFEVGAGHLLDPNSPFQRYRIQKVTDIYAPLPTDQILDLGCGWGTFSLALAPRVARVVGVDFSERSIALCRREAERLGLENVEFVCADAGETGLPSDTFDVVVSADLYEHLYPADSVRVTREAYRVLKPEGRFVVWTPHRGHFLEVLKNRNILLKRDPSHVDYKSMARMKELLADAGFDVERAYYAESHVPLLRVVERAFMGLIPALRRRIAVLGRKPPKTITSNTYSA